MRVALVLSLLLTSLLLAFCPLGFPPEQACPVDSPACALFADGDGDTLCDNPEAAAEPEDEVPETIPPDTTDVSEEPPVEEPEELPDPPEQETPSDLFCPLGFLPSDACHSSSPSCALFVDGDGDSLCDNPGPQPLPEPEDPEPEPEEPVTGPEPEPEDPPAEPENPESEIIETPVELVPCPLGYTLEEACPVDSPGCALFRDPDESGFCDNPLLNAEDTNVIDPDSVVVATSDVACPLGFTPDEACPPEDPKCALFIDVDVNGACDNPGAMEVLTGTADTSDWQNLGCPLDLDPDQSCHHSIPLCPHWFGVAEGTSCSSPQGGDRRLWTVLIGLVVLLPVSRILSRRLRGRRIKERMARQKAHTVIRAVSLIVLGVAVQGCFCPLGTFQYLFLPGGLAFLGVLGLIILLLPVLQSMFCGRIFCAWVCPMGGLQEFLYGIHIPGQFSPSGRVHRVLIWLKYVILAGLVTFLLLATPDRAGQWQAVFCRFDPFKTVFSLFVSGSLIIAGTMILLAMFIRRFFCRYICFYGALLSIFNRAHLLTRFRKRSAPEVEEAEVDSDDEFDR